VEREIALVRFAQAVELSKSSVNYINPDIDSATGIRKDSPKYKLTRTNHGMLIEGPDGECVEVFNTNIAYIKYKPTKLEQKKSK